MVGPLLLVFENLRQSSGVFGSLRKSETNCCKMARKRLDILNKIILAFLEPFLLLSGKIYCFKEFFTVSVNCLKFNCFMLQSHKNEVFSVIEVNLFRPSISESLFLVHMIPEWILVLEREKFIRIENLNEVILEWLVRERNFVSVSEGWRWNELFPWKSFRYYVIVNSL